MKLTRTAIAVAVLIASSILTGCTPAVPASVSTPDPVSTKSRAQLFKETTRQLNDVAVYLGGEWVDVQSGRSWNPDTATPGWPENCVGSSRYNVQLMQDGPIADPMTEIAKVRAYWKKLGYTDFGQIGPRTDSQETYAKISVFLPGKAGMQLSASSTTGLLLNAQSECGHF